LVDTVRLHHTGDGPYTWWDYRMLGFPKNNGLRIDHVLATPALAERCRSAHVDRDERKGKLPSDHAPVVASFTGA
jgi:exodeoxyribonuclease-3